MEPLREQRQGTSLEKRLADFLIEPREELHIELKSWLDLTKEEWRADLAQALLALANHGGGYVILGHKESQGRWIPDTPRPTSLKMYEQDIVNDIIQRYADPVFHCQAAHVAHSETGEIFPIIVVPGGHRVPIRARRGGPDGKHVQVDLYYIRRPGPRSEPPRTAQEWDELIQRCIRAGREELLDRIREVVLGGQVAAVDLQEPKKPGPEQQLLDWVQSCEDHLNHRVGMELTPERRVELSRGRWAVGYLVSGPFNRPDLKELKELLERVKGHETGWPPWWVPTREEIAPFPIDGLIECWLKDSHFRGPAHSDFWRASPSGMLFLSRGYHEDGNEGEYVQLGPKQGFDLTLPIWRIGECLLHASRFSQALVGNEAEVFFQARWDGLAGRKLYRRDYGLLELSHQPARQHAIASMVKAKGGQIEEFLEELVDQLTKPLYELFDFYKVPRTVISAELKKMRGR